MRRAHVLAGSALACGALGVAVLGGAASPDQDARIPGAPLSRPSPEEIAAFGNLAIATQIPAIPKQAVAATATATAAAPSAPMIELDKIRLDGDHYVTTLSDGRHVVLTLDPDLQALAEKLLIESRAPQGAIVAMAPDGRILALAGRRAANKKGSRDGTFDPQLAVDTWAPAASVFKLATATALVEAGVDPDDKVCFHGGIRSVMESNLRDDKHDSRCESLTYGVAHSNNAILGKLAYQKLDPARLRAAADKLHWTSALPELRGTMGALGLPAQRDLEFARDAAGFATDAGGAKLSVIGGALIAATFANAGDRPAPRLIESIDGTAVPAPPKEHAIAQATAHAVAKMMVQTCAAGSAARSFGRRRTSSPVAGKTGTLTRTDPFYMEHSWFVGFAPADQPEIVVSVLLGNPENWYLRGQEAARRMIDRATGREKDRRRRNRS